MLNSLCSLNSRTKLTVKHFLKIFLVKIVSLIHSVMKMTIHTACQTKNGGSCPSLVQMPPINSHHDKKENNFLPVFVSNFHIIWPSSLFPSSSSHIDHCQLLNIISYISCWINWPNASVIFSISSFFYNSCTKIITIWNLSCWLIFYLTSMLALRE